VLSTPQNLTIDGPGASKTTVSGTGMTRGFSISRSSTRVVIDGLTIANGSIC
jgi:hypothetical protein